MVEINRSRPTPDRNVPARPGLGHTPRQDRRGLSTDALTVDEGSSGTFTVKLASEPSQEETVYMYMWPPRLGTRGPNGRHRQKTAISNPDALLTFDAGTWDTPADADGNHAHERRRTRSWMRGRIVYGSCWASAADLLPQDWQVDVCAPAHEGRRSRTLLIALASAPTTPLPTHTDPSTTENDATAVASLLPDWPHECRHGSLYGAGQGEILHPP